MGVKRLKAASLWPVLAAPGSGAGVPAGTHRRQPALINEYRLLAAGPEPSPGTPSLNLDKVCGSSTATTRHSQRHKSYRVANDFARSLSRSRSDFLGIVATVTDEHQCINPVLPKG